MGSHHLTDEQIAFFDANGYLILRNWITGPLLEALQSAGTVWMERGTSPDLSEAERGDYAWAKREVGEVMYRVDYLHDKGQEASLAMLGAPQVLGVAESLCGRNFVPTYESMVFKQEGDGEVIRWHQDAVHPRKHRIFNYDLYLDSSRQGAGALVVIPGSQRDRLDACRLEEEHGWSPPGSTVVEMEPGDVLLHDVMVVHGSPRALGNALRRTIYYEFRAAEQILEEGPWDIHWVTSRLKLIPLGLRAFARMFPDSPQFHWQPDPQFQQEIEPDADLKIAHVVHTPGSHCSAGSVL
ncbi:phytanoyl-CoA dioxygenase family protein [Fimbriimonas ginsengisoli]|uniref:Phytanoyl-CoA dioxygenase n=1 Tax=Fimbriimonas ginsengisoli Gsoil 348 TaxID=661478 RepID=A0A068NS54_FIMGI|nr:phytanoyl-CoA dioxygenase family protein [Fimbriimonas ginsengisoli]AIE84444.1 phytanoyl-CoA dioxygenase [Fimbriimonas ginsengisoli Gsoil 348]